MELVLRDRNHPCVVIWSICNEKLCSTSDTLGDAQRMHGLFHSLDPHGQRPVSANYNGWDNTKTPLDLDGFDYETSTYDNNHKAVPNVPSISSETSSAVSDRGYYAADDAKSGHVQGYDTDHPGWGQTAEDAWGGVTEPANQGILTRAFVAGSSRPFGPPRHAPAHPPSRTHARAPSLRTHHTTVQAASRGLVGITRASRRHSRGRTSTRTSASLTKPGSRRTATSGTRRRSRTGPRAREWCTSFRTGIGPAPLL